MTTLPIHETFQQTLQGEGFWAGTPVDFIRLAGCPVQCHFCDTGYADGGKDTPRTNRTVDELVAEVRSPRVVITGGEPFIHKQLPALVDALHQAGKQVSVETSGAFWQSLPGEAWITLSPKQHTAPKYPVHPAMWLRADEIKIVVSSGSEVQYYNFHLHHWPFVFTDWGYQNAFHPEFEQLLEEQSVTDKVFLQPEWNERDRTIPLTLELLKQHPQYRLSFQLHKVLGVR